jgi:hypothetical protein
VPELIAQFCVTQISMTQTCAMETPCAATAHTCWESLRAASGAAERVLAGAIVREWLDRIVRRDDFEDLFFAKWIATFVARA